MNIGLHFKCNDFKRHIDVHPWQDKVWTVPTWNLFGNDTYFRTARVTLYNIFTMNNSFQIVSPWLHIIWYLYTLLCHVVCQVHQMFKTRGGDGDTQVDGDLPLEPRNPYQCLSGILAEKGYSFVEILAEKNIHLVFFFSVVCLHLYFCLFYHVLLFLCALNPLAKAHYKCRFII